MNQNELIKETVPEDILQKETLNWGKPKSEREALYHLRVTAAKNKVLTSLIGQDIMELLHLLQFNEIY